MVEPWQTLVDILREAFDRVRSPQGGSPQGEGESFIPEYDRVFASLTRAELYGDSTSLMEEDLVAELFDREQRASHFLDFYSAEGLELAFERYGFFQLLRDRGFEPTLLVDLANPDEHRLRIYDAPARSPTERANLLIELGIARRTFPLPNGVPLGLLFINWLMMQNPRAAFAADRPALPDQEHPGLGLFPHFGYLIQLMALRLECDGLLDYPAHFHNAHLYGRFFHFVDPMVEGRFRALERDLAHLPLARATEAVDAGLVCAADGEVVIWQAQPQVAAITNRARAWFADDGYREQRDRAFALARFRLKPPSEVI